VIRRLSTPSGTVNPLNPVSKSTVTGAAADAGGLAAKAKTRPSTTTAPSAPSTRPALVLSESHLRAETAAIDPPRFERGPPGRWPNHPQRLDNP